MRHPSSLTSHRSPNPRPPTSPLDETSSPLILPLLLVIVALLTPYIYRAFSPQTSLTSSISSYLSTPAVISSSHAVQSLHTTLDSLAAYKAHHRRALTRKENAYHGLARRQRAIAEQIGYGGKIHRSRDAIQGNSKVVAEMIEVGKREGQGGRAWKEASVVGWGAGRSARELEHGRVVEVLKQSVYTRC